MIKVVIFTTKTKHFSDIECMQFICITHYINTEV